MHASKHIFASPAKTKIYADSFIGSCMPRLYLCEWVTHFHAVPSEDFVFKCWPNLCMMWHFMHGVHLQYSSVRL